ARDLIHDALEAVDLAEGELEVLVEQVVVLLGVEPLGDRGRAGEVAEEDGHLLALARDGVLRGADLGRERLRNVTREARERFVVRLDGAEATLVYERRGDLLDLQHTFTPPALRGREIAARLTEAAFAYARAQGLRIVPTCSYTRSYLARHEADPRPCLGSGT